jgi:hypothetical protein
MANHQQQTIFHPCVLFSIFLLCVACTNEITEKAKFKTVYLHSQPGSIEVIQSDLGVTFKVRSPFGIGNGEIELLEGSWPDNSTVHLYLKGLEGLSIVSSNKKLSKPELEIKKYSKNGESYFEFKLPISLLADPKVIKLNWVDFYR